MFKSPENYYQYAYHDRKFYVMPKENYIEFKSITRDGVTPTVNPYKFSVAMLSQFRRKIYITLTNYEFEYDVGFKRDWIALLEGINEGIRLFEELIARRKEVVPKKKKRFILI